MDANETVTELFLDCGERRSMQKRPPSGRNFDIVPGRSDIIDFVHRQPVPGCAVDDVEER